MADDSHRTPFDRPAIADNVVYLNGAEPNWRSVGSAAQGVVERAKREHARRNVPYEEYHLAPDTGEGTKYGWGECRICGREVRVYVDWCEGDGPAARSTGGLDGCTQEKCGDKVPATITRMACNPDYTGEPRAQQLQNILDILELANYGEEPQDPFGVSLAWEWLIDWRMGAAE